MHNQKQMMSSVRPDWNTPEVVLIGVRSMLAVRFGSYSRDRIDLDPCANAEGIVNARVELTVKSKPDGLTANWAPLTRRPDGTYGLAFVNPPYGRALLTWAAKISAEGTHGRTEIVALVPARTDTKWFGMFFRTASAIAFWRGRIKFLGAASSAPFPSALIYFGRHAQAFIDAFKRNCFVYNHATEDALFQREE